MRRWWKAVGVLAGSLASLGGIASSASAQLPPPPGGGMGMPPGMMAPPGMGMPPGGMGMAPGMPTASPGGMPPGAFGGNPAMAGQPAVFPNPAVPSQEPVSPFTIKDEGMPNAFTELIDPRPRLAPTYCVAFRFEYLNWWVSKGPTATDLVTTTSTPSVTNFGALGQSGTQILLPASDTTFDYGRLSGGRVTMGLAIGYLPPIEVSGFDFNRKATAFSGGSTDATGQFLARPAQLADFPVAPGIGAENAIFVNVPGFASGTMSVVSRLSFWGVEANTFCNFADTDCFKMDLFVGYRHADLYEALDITNTFGGFAGNPIFGGAIFPQGTSRTMLDSFRARNAFDGGQLGVRTIFTASRWSLFTDVKLAMGNTRHVLGIDGSTTLYQPAVNRPAQTLPAGLLALTTNSGTVTDNGFSIIPEANMNLSYQLTPNLRLFGGYTFLYWTNVIRPGDHLNSVIDSRQVPASVSYNPNVAAIAPPFPTFVTRNFWAHGFNVGIEIGF